VVLERARRLERDVYEAAVFRFPDRAGLAHALAHAAFVDAVWCAGRLDAPPNPVTPLRRLWSAGYALSAVDSHGVIVEVPPL
jgi:hypothetical protein